MWWWARRRRNRNHSLTHVLLCLLACLLISEPFTLIDTPEFSLWQLALFFVALLQWHSCWAWTSKTCLSVWQAQEWWPRGKWLWEPTACRKPLMPEMPCPRRCMAASSPGSSTESLHCSSPGTLVAKSKSSNIALKWSEYGEPLFWDHHRSWAKLVIRGGWSLTRLMFHWGLPCSGIIV